MHARYNFGYYTPCQSDDVGAREFLASHCRVPVWDSVGTELMVGRLVVAGRVQGDRTGRIPMRKVFKDLQDVQDPGYYGWNI